MIFMNVLTGNFLRLTDEENAARVFILPKVTGGKLQN